MKKNGQPSSVFSERLRQARIQAGLTQIQLGVRAGIDEFSASARVNQYERGVHSPEFGTAVRLAAALRVPVSYLYEPDEVLAEVIFFAGRLSKDKLESTLTYIHSFL
jgi:transcriptional regulator with XRE-family HTH domain